MKKALSLVAFACTTQWAIAQPSSENLYEGFNVSFGVASHSTKETMTGTETFKTSVPQTKINYTFAMAFPVKLGVTATLDLKNSTAGASDVLATKTPSELTIEPGILLMSDSLLYAKLGTYAARYENATDGRSVSGRTVGFGIKHYIYGDNFIQFELTTRTSDAINAGLGDAKYKQTSPSLLIGHTY
jgi:hypothetical protein